MSEFKHGPEFSTLTHRAVKAAQAVVNTQWTNQSALPADHPVRLHAQNTYRAVVDHINQHNPHMASDDAIYSHSIPTAEFHAMGAVSGLKD
jgi:hypothetical protein